MSTPEFYRAEAARCRRLAARGTDPAARRRWQQFADEYDQLAAAMEMPAPSAPTVRMPMQQQPVQQQQKKTEEK